MARKSRTTKAARKRKAGGRCRVKVLVEPFVAIDEAIRFAIERGMNRCDKYHWIPLKRGQRDLLLREISASFWIALDDAGLELC